MRRTGAGDVSGWSALWLYFRSAPLLVSQAIASAGAGHAHAEYTYAYAAVSPLDGRLDSLILPHVNGHCMQIFLDEIAARYPNEPVVMVLNGAGWHRSQDIRLPDHLRLLPLPLSSPELNPQEHIWDDLREKYFLHHAFDSMDALEDKLEAALVNYETAPARVHPIIAWNWIITALPN